MTNEEKTKIRTNRKGKKCISEAKKETNKKKKDKDKEGKKTKTKKDKQT